MEEELLKQITKQLKILNFWITLFGTVIIVSIFIGGVVVFKVIQYTDKKLQKFDAFQQQTSKTLNVKQQLCDSNSLSDILKAQSGIC